MFIKNTNNLVIQNYYILIQPNYIVGKKRLQLIITTSLQKNLHTGIQVLYLLQILKMVSKPLILSSFAKNNHAGRIQILRKLIGSLLSPCACSFIGAGPCF